HRVRGALGAGPVAPLGDDVLDVDVAVAAGDGVGGVVPALTGELGEGLAVQVEQDVAVLGGVAGAAVADEEVGLLAVVDDVALGAQRPAGAGGQALLHGLAAGGGAGVAVDAGTVVPEVGRLDFAVLDRAVRTHVKSTRSVAGRSRPGAADPGMTGSGHGGFGHAAGAHLRRAVRECAGPAPFSAPLGAVLAASAAAPRPPLIVGASTGRARSAPGWDTGPQRPGHEPITRDCNPRKSKMRSEGRQSSRSSPPHRFAADPAPGAAQRVSPLPKVKKRCSSPQGAGPGSTPGTARRDDGGGGGPARSSPAACSGPSGRLRSPVLARRSAGPATPPTRPPRPARSRRRRPPRSRGRAG